VYGNDCSDEQEMTDADTRKYCIPPKQKSLVAVTVEAPPTINRSTLVSGLLKSRADQVAVPILSSYLLSAMVPVSKALWDWLVKSRASIPQNLWSIAKSVLAKKARALVFR